MNDVNQLRNYMVNFVKITSNLQAQPEYKSGVNETNLTKYRKYLVGIYYWWDDEDDFGCETRIVTILWKYFWQWDIELKIRLDKEWEWREYFMMR